MAQKFIPNFRVYVHLSDGIDEIILAAGDKEPLSPYYLDTSPYIDEDAGYSWREMMPNIRLPYPANPEDIGRNLRIALQIPTMPHQSEEYQTLWKAFEMHRKQIDEHKERFLTPPFSYYGSSALTKDYFEQQYIHLILEDIGEGQYGLFKNTISYLPFDNPPDVRISANCSNEELSLAILRLAESQIAKGKIIELMKINMEIKPGNRVRIIENQYENLSAASLLLLATKNSIARVIPMDEFVEYYLDALAKANRQSYSPEKTELLNKIVKENLNYFRAVEENQSMCPVKFEVVEPPDPPLAHEYDAFSCKVGYIILIEPQDLEVRM